jgi:glycosyltransferase involved in cell wall biosynthesis
LRILYLQATSEVGGSDIALLRLVSALDRERFQPLVVLPHPGPLVESYAGLSVPVCYLGQAQLRSVRSISHQGRYLLRFWPTVVRLSRLVKREHIDLVHSNSLYELYGAWAARLAGVPHVWHLREIPDSAVISPVLGSMASLLSSRAVAVSEAVARRLCGHRRQDGASSRVVVIHDGIDTAMFSPRVSGDRVKLELGVAAGSPLVTFAGRLDPWKGAEVFIKAAAIVAGQHATARFLVCGGVVPGYEAYEASLRELTRTLGLENRVLFSGWTYRPQDMPEVMSASDILVHTSVRPEPFGLVLIEAMAAGLPVVAADAGGVPEVVERDVTGLLAAPGNHQRVAEQVDLLLGDRTAARRMGAAGRERVTRLFSLDLQARRIEDLYQALVTP